jgi:putrescine transport system substrate-binding protein
MKKKFIYLFSLLFLVVIIIFNNKDSKKELNIFNWAGYINPEIIQDFEKKYNVKINYDVFDNNYVLESKLMISKKDYDIVFPSSSPFLINQLRLGVYQKLDLNKLPNYKNIDEYFLDFLASVYESNYYAIPYLWGTIGIGYNQEEAQKRLGTDELDSLDYFFNPELLAKMTKCGIEILDTPLEIIPLIMNYKGIPRDNVTPENLKIVENVLKSIRPYIKNINQTGYISNVASAETCLVIGYSGDIIQANEAAKESNTNIVIKYKIPKEGSEIWMDVMAMPKNSHNSEIAYKFIDFLLDPEVIAKVSNYIHYPNSNKNSFKFLDKDLQENELMFLDRNNRDKLYYGINYSEKDKRAMNTLWLKFIKNSFE